MTINDYDIDEYAEGAIILDGLDEAIIGIVVEFGDGPRILYSKNKILNILCERDFPVFVVGQDNVIMRLRERYLPPFLYRLKQAYLSNEGYLKYLRINTRLVNACNCEHKIAHSYCITASLLIDHKIYCSDCN